MTEYETAYANNKIAVGALVVEFKGEDDKRNFRDGDAGSTFATDYPLDTTGLTIEQMENGKFDPSDVLVPRINNNSRVYKGGSWNDGPYYLSPSARRFMNEDEASSTVGFRCAMNKIGSALAK